MNISMPHFEQEEFRFPLNEETVPKETVNKNIEEEAQSDVPEGGREPQIQESFVYDKEEESWNKDRKKIYDMLAEEHMKEIFDNREKFAEKKQETKKMFENFLAQSLDEVFSRKFSGFFEGKTGEGDLELLTLIRVYGDSYLPEERKGELFDHSLGVFKVATEAYPKTLVSEIEGGRVFYDIFGKIRQEMCIEGDGVHGEEQGFEMAFREFLRACLLHDVGKISLPEFVVYNSVTNQQSRKEIRKLSLRDAGNLFVQFQNAQWFPVSLRLDGEEYKFSKKREERRENGGEKLSPQEEECRRREESNRRQREALLLETLFSDFDTDERRKFENGEECVFSEDKQKYICDWLDREDVDARVNIAMPVGMLVDFDVNLNFLGNEDEKAIEQKRRGDLLTKLGISSDTPFMKVIDQHEQRSGSLLEAINDPILKVLASYHHNKAHKIPHFFDSDISDATLERLEEYFKEYGVHVDTKDHPTADASISFIHLCDVFDALRSARSYKKSFPLDRTLFTLIKDAEGMGGKPNLNLQTTAFFIELQVRKEYERKLIQEQHLSAQEASEASVSHEYEELLDDLNMDSELKRYIQDFLDKQQYELYPDSNS